MNDSYLDQKEVGLLVIKPKPRETIDSVDEQLNILSQFIFELTFVISPSSITGYKLILVFSPLEPWTRNRTEDSALSTDNASSLAHFILTSNDFARP
jgi:hypothetical protein